MKQLAGGMVPIKAWTDGVELEEEASKQLYNVSMLPFIYKHIAVMPDVHWGIGATVGSVIPTKGAIIPAAVGVDIGCGMLAARTDLDPNLVMDNLKQIRDCIENKVPVGNSSHIDILTVSKEAWDIKFKPLFRELIEPIIPKAKTHPIYQLGSLGGGNHFIEICIDTKNRVWIMLHSGSRGVGNKIGTVFIEKAKKDVESNHVHLPDRNLAYFEEGSPNFKNYIKAVGWAQEYAKVNREIMFGLIRKAICRALQEHTQNITVDLEVVNCHHNYVTMENHFGESVYVTRKGAVNAETGKLGIIPGSMGAKSYIVRGKGNADSFNSCSHGAGRRMSRGKAKSTFTVEQHEEATKGVECRKDLGVLDETPLAYKDIDAVMEAQKDLVEIVETLKQVICVKG